MWAFKTLFAGLLVASSIIAQPSKPPAFDIADVHASASAANPFSLVSGGILRGSRYDLRKATMLDLIRIAWGVDADKIVGGPSWLELNRFDISAKAPEDTPTETVKLMLQQLLKDRFKLVVRPETRLMPAFVLAAGKGQSKMKASDGSGSSDCKPQSPNGSTYTSFSCRNMSMAAFSVALRRMASDYLPEQIVDSTGMEGSWDFDINWNPRSRILQAGADRVTIFDAVEKQMGLALELKKAPAAVVVVERANEIPSPNPPRVAEFLPPRSLEFEVASIKASAPDERGGYKLSPSGRLELRNFLMRDLLSEAWDIDWNHMDERIAGAPKWADTKRFDIIAKTGGATEVPRGTGFMDDDLRLMLRALLIDRFNHRSL